MAKISPWMAIDAAKAVNDALNNAFGMLEDSVEVRVTGAPGSTKRQLHALAASVAFGMAKPLIFLGGGALTPPGAIGVEYDAARMELTFVLKYSRSVKSILASGAAAFLGLGGGGRDALVNQPVFRGPLDEVKGAGFEFRPPVPGGIAPGNLPFNGKTILTTSRTCEDPNPAIAGAGPTVPTLNPRPAGDARSRGSLCDLVFQSLATPASFATQTYDLPDDANRFTGG